VAEAKIRKIQNVSKATTNKQVGYSVPKVGIIIVAIYNHMVVIQVQIGKNKIKNVLLDGGFRVNIHETIEIEVRLLKPNLVPYNLRMAEQTTTKPMGLIRDMKIYVHGIFYIITFTVFQNSVVDSSYSMLLGRPWLRDVKVAHDWGSNNVTIQGNGTLKTIIVTKHLGGEIRKLEMLLCYDY
jgi:hypothetical protein